MNRKDRRKAGIKEKPVAIYHMTADDIEKIKKDAVQQAVNEWNRLNAEVERQKQKNLDAEIYKALKEKDVKFQADVDACILWVLHKFFGFGTVRLRRFWEQFNAVHVELWERYGEDSPWKCRVDLKQIGVDVDKWNEELED